MIRSVHKRRSRAGRRDLLQQAVCAHTRRGPGTVTWWSPRTGSGRAHKIAYPTHTTSKAIARQASSGARPSAPCQSIDAMNLAPRQTLSMFFRSCSSTPWPSDKPIGLPHVPKRPPCGNRFGFRSRWTADARERKNRALYRTETCVECTNWAGLQLDPNPAREGAGRYLIIASRAVWAPATVLVIQ